VHDERTRAFDPLRRNLGDIGGGVIDDDGRLRPGQTAGEQKQKDKVRAVHATSF
jgi:hypothetical protein